MQDPPAGGGAGNDASDGGDERDVGARLGALTEAVERLARSHQAMLEATGRTTATGADPASPLAASRHPDPAAGPRDELRRVVAEVLAERDSSARRSEARQRYVREHMGDLPEAYRRQVPESDDPAALAAAEREVRRRYREDFREALGRFADLGDANPDAGDNGAAADGGLAPDRFAGLVDVGGDGGASLGGARPGDVVDWSKLSPLQQITLGLRDARPQGAAPQQHPLVQSGGRPRRPAPGAKSRDETEGASGAD